ncbi:T9SS type A sorting domain-containing protein [Ferruginibacter albus]|uniref:T9SS type A sorting domain-containing protein n=1 Tax=Ferruginibacter albus TaxID=2875540 RepID=UPI001CC3D9D6|nr:T9SS type A sorting domain-containing protein [Ferruginibacter albus]UAY52944.1 T9SS type A sorting domain-containing protein [Ferruginibacter albus]
MALDNLISIEITDEQMKTINDALTIIEDALAAQLVNLTPKQRQSHARVRYEMEIWVQKANSYMDNNPPLVPNYIDIDENRKDLSAHTKLNPFIDRIEKLLQSVLDTNLLLGTDLYNNAMSFYRSLKMAARSNATCNNGRCDTSIIVLNAPMPTPDTVTVKASCPNCAVNVCAVVNDVDTTGGATYDTCGIPTGYSASSISESGCMTFTPDGTVTSTQTTCIITCNNGRCDTSIVILLRPKDNVMPITFTLVKAIPEQNNMVTVQWNVENQVNISSYVIEKSTDGIHYNNVARITATETNTYTWKDNNASGNNYYRIISVEVNGRKEYSNIVKASLSKNEYIKVLDRIQANGTMQLKFNSMAPGNYRVILFNDIGQLFSQREISFGGGTAIVQIQLNTILTKGIYMLKIQQPNGKITTEKIRN